MKEARKPIQRTPLEIRETLNQTYRLVNVHPAIVKAVGEKIAREFIQEFNRRDEERNRKQTEVLFYEFGCDYLNPIINTLTGKPPEHNSFLELLLECLDERMQNGIRISHRYRAKLGLKSWDKNNLTYEYDADKYPYI